MKNYLFHFLFFSLLISLHTPIKAQKVILVLSGGGSKGMAHVGVLRALEENHIPIDGIVGTSMGGIIGGMYAAGFSIQEIEQWVISEDFQNWAAGRIDKDYRYFLYQREPNASMLSLKVSLDSLFQISLRNSSLVKDYPLNFALAEHLASASAISNCNFDSLFVPYRCIASEIFTQETVVLSDGNLNEALRATLNVPLFFPPVKVKGKYLFDGGIYNNFPVNLARRIFKPDVVIGVNVSDKTFMEYPYEEDEKHINYYLLYMILSRSDSSQLKNNDVYIEPLLTEYSSTDFSKGAIFVANGYELAMEKMNEIEAKVTRRVHPDSLQKKRALFRQRMPTLEIGTVEVSGLEKPQERYVKNMFYRKNQQNTMESIKRQYFRLAQTEKFDVLMPNFLYKEDKKKYDFLLAAKSNQSIRAEIGGNLASRNISTFYLATEYDYLRNWLYTFGGSFYFGRFYASTNLGIKINVPFRMPFYFRPYFIYNEWNYLNLTELFFNQNQTILLQNDNKVGFEIVFAAGKTGKFILDVAQFRNNDRYSNNDFFSTNISLDLTRLEGQVYTMRYLRNNLNRKQYASDGTALTLALHWIDATEYHLPGMSSIFSTFYEKQHQWLVLKARLEHYFDFRRYSIGLLGECAYANQPLFRNTLSSLIVASAFYPMPDSPSFFMSSFRSPSFVALGLKNIYKFTSNIELRLGIFGFTAYNPIKEITEQIPLLHQNTFDAIRWAGNLSLVYHSRLGPISASANYYDEQSIGFNFLFNIGFMLYNKRAIE